MVIDVTNVIRLAAGALNSGDLFTDHPAVDHSSR